MRKLYGTQEPHKKTIDKEKLGSAIEHALKIDGRSVRQVAISLGIAPSVFHQYKTGKSVPEIINYNKIREWALKNSVDLNHSIGLD